MRNCFIKLLMLFMAMALIISCAATSKQGKTEANSPLKTRRVVTGHSPDGKSIFVSDEMVDPITISLAPGSEFISLWGADNTVTLPGDGSMPPTKTWFPPLGGVRFGLFTAAPLSTKGPEKIDMKTAIEEVEKKLPGMMKHMEPDSPGMHTSDTVDFAYVISGEVWLELDDGKEVHLQPGDTVIQNGTRHAWRNKGTEPCQMVTILIGANRK